MLLAKKIDHIVVYNEQLKEEFTVTAIVQKTKEHISKNIVKQHVLMYDKYGDLFCAIAFFIHGIFNSIKWDTLVDSKGNLIPHDRGMSEEEMKAVHKLQRKLNYG